MALHLRVFPAPDDVEDFSYKPEDDQHRPATVPVRLGELLPMISLAQKLKFMWLKDFLDDEVLISSDLNDVLQAFQGCKPKAS